MSLLIEYLLLELLTQCRAASHAPLSRSGYAGMTSNVVDRDVGLPSYRAIAPDKLTPSTWGCGSLDPIVRPSPGSRTLMSECIPTHGCWNGIWLPMIQHFPMIGKAFLRETEHTQPGC